jgi:hypothetical protein
MEYPQMSERDSTALLLDEEVDGLALEKENRELASKQVRKINDTLRKVRKISRDSQQMVRPVLLEAVLPAPVEPESSSVIVEEVFSARGKDARRERDDSTDKILIPEPALDSPVGEVFRKAFEMFEAECTQFRFTRNKNSPVVRSWKLA